MNSERELYARAIELAESGAGDAAVLFDLSGIARIEDQGIARAVSEILDERIGHVPHEAFALPRRRWMFITDSASAKEIESQIADFSDFLTRQGRGAIRQTRFDLKRNADAFREICAAIVNEDRPGRADGKDSKLGDLDRLIGFESQLKGADLSPFIRTRRIWRVENGEDVTEIAREVLILRPRIEALLEISFSDGSWLARHTAELFDRHLTRHLLREYRLSRRRLPPFLVPLLASSLENPDIAADLGEMHGIALIESGNAAEIIAIARRVGVTIALGAGLSVPAAPDPCVRFLLSSEARGGFNDRLVLLEPDEAAFQSAIKSGISYFEGDEIPEWTRDLGAGAEAAPPPASHRSIEDAATETAQEEAAKQESFIGHIFGRHSPKH